MDDLLQLILTAADDEGRSFDHAEVATWPIGGIDYFCRLGVLRMSSGSLMAPCPNCSDGHIEPVTIRAGPDGTERFYIWCPESLRTEVEPATCSCWEVDPDGLASLVAEAMNLNGKPKQVVPNRLWRLGRIPWRDTTRQVVFARRLVEADASSIAVHVGIGGRDIVVVPRHVPDTRAWPGIVPAVIVLSDVMLWDDDQPVLDVMAMVEAVETADSLATTTEAIALGPTGKKMVRQQVKAEMKGQLEDDVLVAVYKTYGSVRKAAEALTKQLERTITKDKVQGAVTRAGGAKALRAEMDTASFSRSVASQRRDRSKKMEQYRK